MNSAAKGLRADQVHIWRGDRHVLKGVSLSVSPGEMLHVSGVNGAGKTTLLRVVCGLMRPEQGAVAWRGTSIHEDPMAYQADMAYASHEPALKADLTVLENLRYAVGLKRSVSAPEIRSHLDRLGVASCADLPARVLSAGQRRRVSMARVVAMRASLWLLDEPFANLDAPGCDLLLQLLDEHLAQGGLALVAAHQDIRLARAASHLELAA
ncbi:MAG TPA: cytochrome c biogenesis heme-transporting ATPase CcmA [Steroidobacteraceae bacterium]|jgi:heme exporter protein A|nr:cytochrome c biogenesis heme-transporting ATPase CcmA [Steroidobacteraceae bacterium]